MEKRVINPWEWQNKRSYVQAVEVRKAEATLYIAGQTAIDENDFDSVPEEIHFFNPDYALE